MRDALQLYDVLQDRHQAISVIGRSLGSGVAAYLASQRPVQRLLLITPHDSALAIAQRLYPIYPVAWMLKDKYESVKYAAKITAPTLILTAEQDQVIPPPHSDRLAAAFADGLVSRAVIEGAGHNGISGYAEYWNEVGGFLGEPSGP